MSVLFSKFEVFENKHGELEVANLEKEMVLTDRYTGQKTKCDIEGFCRVIKTVFPDREEQRELLQQMFCDDFEDD